MIMKKIVALILFCLTCPLAFGSHLRCGYITAQSENCSSKNYSITVTVYINTGSDVKFGEDGILNFGDGSTLTVPAVNAIPRPDLGPNIGIVQFTISHIFPRQGTFLISYTEPNRNAGVRNMDDSHLTTFYVETSILISKEFGCPTSPSFLTSPVLHASTGTDFTYSMGVSSDEDNLLTYELVVPFRDRGLPVINYVTPANLSINYLSGLLTWDTNFQGASLSGEYNFAVQVNHHIKTGETYTPIGFMRIDFQVIVEDDVTSPVSIKDIQNLDVYSRILVPEGEEKHVKVFFESTGGSTIQAFSELVENEAFSFEAYDSTHEETTFKVGVITISPDATLVRENPYLITVRAKSGGFGSDINYLIYTEEIPDLPVITPPVITTVEQGLDEVVVYPNPTYGDIILRVSHGGVTHVVLFTTLGTPAKHATFEWGTEINLADLPSGIYICEVYSANSVIHKTKVIKR